MPPVPLSLLPPDDPRAARLMTAQQRELRTLYGDTDERTEPFDPGVLAGEGGVLLGVEEGGELLACGALKRLDAAEAEFETVRSALAEAPAGLTATLGHVGQRYLAFACAPAAVASARSSPRPGSARWS